MLLYRFAWKIERKGVYSLFQKCTQLKDYLLNSLEKYLKIQSHIAQVYKLVREQILHTTERKDCLDYILEMKIERLMNNPIIIEVLNLVYEGQYSVDCSITSLSMSL